VKHNVRCPDVAFETGHCLHGPIGADC
jgi:hypothetical protein